jgi:hypothetical protein
MQATRFGMKIPPLNSRNITKEKSQTTKFNTLNRKKKKKKFILILRSIMTPHNTKS